METWSCFLTSCCVRELIWLPVGFLLEGFLAKYVTPKISSIQDCTLNVREINKNMINNMEEKYNKHFLCGLHEGLVCTGILWMTSFSLYLMSKVVCCNVCIMCKGFACNIYNNKSSVFALGFGRFSLLLLLFCFLAIDPKKEKKNSFPNALGLFSQHALGHE